MAENADQYEEEIAFLKDMQSKLLPKATEEVPDINDARELVSRAVTEAFAEVHKGRFQRRAPDEEGRERAFTTWCIGFLRNKIKEFRRERKTLPLIEDPKAQAVTAEDQAVINEYRALVRSAVAALPLNLQRAVRLRYFANLKPPEIAMKMGVNVSTVHKYLRRALRKLRKRFPDEDIR